MFDKLINSFSYRLRKYHSRLQQLYWDLLNGLIVSDKRNKNCKESLFLFVPVWGDKHIDLFFDYTLPSLMQSKNIPYISKLNKRIVLCFYTKDGDSEKIDRKIKKYNFKHEYKIYIESNFHDKSRNLMLNFFLHIIDKCIYNNALMLLAMPDTIYSNGSIGNLFKLSNEKGVSIAVPHPRVSYECIKENNKLEELFQDEISSPDLVGIATQCKHSSFEFSNELMDSNSTKDGISTRELTSHCLAVIHNLPNVCLISPIKDDLSFFKKCISFNEIDHSWQNMLLRQSRLKVVGSSNIAFMIELTHDNDKIPKLSSNNRLNDKYDGPKPFCNYANAIISSWESSE